MKCSRGSETVGDRDRDSGAEEGDKEKPKKELESGAGVEMPRPLKDMELQIFGLAVPQERSIPWNQSRAKLQVNSTAEGWSQPRGGRGR